MSNEQPIAGQPAEGQPDTGAQPAGSQPADDEQTPEPKRRGSFWRELPILLGVAIVVAIVVRAFVVETFWIPSESMQHTLEVDDKVLVNKTIYHLRDPARGEIVVFEAPAGWRSGPEGEDFIKRVIAVGGDVIACCDPQQRLLVNGVPLDEPYLYSQNGISDPAGGVPFEVVVPEERLWVLGDHRSASGDSMGHYQRSGGDIMAATIGVDAVVGRAFVLFWPPSHATWLSVPGSFDSLPGSPPG